MSKYTTELRFICETLAERDESVPYSSITNVIEAARPKIFHFPYPIFDQEYKPILETKILKHFYTREIGAETYGLWHLWLNEKMNLIMPFYNKLYLSELLEFDPLKDVDYTRTGSREGESSGTTTNRQVTDQDTTSRQVTDQDTTDTSTSTTSLDSEVETDGEQWDLISDTPQGSLSGINNNTYLTQAGKHTQDDTVTTDSDSTTTSSGSGTNDITVTGSGTNDVITTNNGSTTGETTEEYLERVVGKHSGASYSKLLDEYRATFLRIDEMILEELEPLFMQLW